MDFSQMYHKNRNQRPSQPDVSFRWTEELWSVNLLLLFHRGLQARHPRHMTLAALHLLLLLLVGLLQPHMLLLMVVPLHHMHERAELGNITIPGKVSARCTRTESMRGV